MCTTMAQGWHMAQWHHAQPQHNLHSATHTVNPCGFHTHSTHRYPYPHLLVPIPMSVGMGLHGYGNGSTWCDPWVTHDEHYTAVMHHHWLCYSWYMSFVWCYNGPMELANFNESSRQLLSSEGSGEVSQDVWDFVAGLSQALCAHKYHDTSRVLFIILELTLHGYSVVFQGGMTEGIEGHCSVALEQEIMLFWCSKQGCDNFLLFQQAWRSQFMTGSSSYAAAPAAQRLWGVWAFWDNIYGTLLLGLGNSSGLRQVPKSSQSRGSLATWWGIGCLSCLV